MVQSPAARPNFSPEQVQEFIQTGMMWATELVKILVPGYFAPNADERKDATIKETRMFAIHDEDGHIYMLHVGLRPDIPPLPAELEHIVYPEAPPTNENDPNVVALQENFGKIFEGYSIPIRERARAHSCAVEIMNSVNFCWINLAAWYKKEAITSEGERKRKHLNCHFEFLVLQNNVIAPVYNTTGLPVRNAPCLQLSLLPLSTPAQV